MAKERRSESGWLARRRDKKRQKQLGKAQRAADQRREEGAAAERATHRWDATGGGGGV